jgi:hypothetical protein
MTTEEKIKSKIYKITTKDGYSTKYLNVWVGVNREKYMMFSVISPVDEDDDEMVKSIRKNVEMFYRYNPDVSHLINVRNGLSGAYILMTKGELGPLVNPISQLEMIEFIRDNGGKV